MRLRNNPDAINKLRESKYLIQDFPFQLTKDMVIELGMGKGEMITKMAQENPDIQYIGIEKFATVAYMAAKRAEEMKLKNFLIICDDIQILPSLLKGNVSSMWLTFSDPWPKARHEKRRLTNKIFLNHYKTILGTTGIMHFKTDNDKLFEYSQEHIQENGMEILYQTYDLHNQPIAKNNTMTGYEIKWSEKGKNINYFSAKFKGE